MGQTRFFCLCLCRKRNNFDAAVCWYYTKMSNACPKTYAKFTRFV